MANTASGSALLSETVGADVNDLNPYIRGFYRPQPTEFTAINLPVIGEIPKDLYGAFTRNGPNPIRAPTGLHHWFDGDGMVHAIYFENGKAEYRNRYVRSSDFVADLTGGCGAGGVLKPASRARGEKVYKDTANTDLVIHNGELMALWYISGTPVRMHPRTLETLREETFGGKLPRHVSAHSKVDPVSGEFVFFDYALYEPWMSFGVVSKDNVLTHFSKVDLSGPRLPHDMGLTENYVILHDLPVVFTERGLRNNLWQIELRDQPARFGVVSRTGSGSDIKWFETDPCYIYHVINAWEDGDEVVMTACRMVPNGLKPNPAYGPYASMVAVLNLHAVPTEWRMNMRTGEMKQRQIDDRIGEFPIVNLDKSTRKTRWSYHASIAAGDMQRFDGVYKYDLESGACLVHRYAEGHGGSEAGFAPRIGAVDEDDGYVIVFVTDPNTDRSEVQVINSKAFSDGPVARVLLPGRVPAGFHGTWVRGDQIAANK
jgi:carotenoid cleavage dioxygenase-like enzyme